MENKTPYLRFALLVGALLVVILLLTRSPPMTAAGMYPFQPNFVVTPEHP